MRSLQILGLLAIASFASDMWSDLDAGASSGLTPVASSQAAYSVVVYSSSLAEPISSSMSSSSSVVASSILLSSSSPLPLLASSSTIEQASSVTSSSVLIQSSSSMAPMVSSSSTARSRSELLGPVRVSRVRGIDEMKGKYKSPRKALFLSLLVPGVGQAWVGGSVSNYARAGFYAVTEATLLGLWYHYSVDLYGKQVKSYEGFARTRYSIGKHESQLLTIYQQIADDTKLKEFDGLYLSDRKIYCGAIYKNPDQNNCTDVTKADNHRNFFPADETLDKSLATVGIWDENTLYRMIGSEDYVLGWTDVTDVATIASLDLKDADSEHHLLGVSEDQAAYLAMRDRANRLGNYQAYFLGGVILNHIVSAVDASVAAYFHNKGLYEEQVAWYERVRFDSNVQWFGALNTQVNARLDF